MTKPSVLIPYRHAKKVRAYADAARAGGLEPITISVSDNPSFEGAKALLLMGGTDVNPSRYGETPHAETDQPDDERDEVELALIDKALAADLPLLAICRGFQLLNVFCGGRLIQHLDPNEHPDECEHDVFIEPASKLAEILGLHQCTVNSRHHQALKELGSGLKLSARSGGVVEAFEMTGKHFVIAVQWHPEDLVMKYPEQLTLFEQLAVVSAARATGVVV